MDALLDFLAHGGVKLLIIAVAIGAHFMKRNAEKALREGQPREMPNSMPSQNAMTVQNPTAQSPMTSTAFQNATGQSPSTPNSASMPNSAASPQQAAPPTPTLAPPPPAKKQNTQNIPESPWSSSTNPFDGKKK